ncbi:MAG: EamA family transporter [Clostridia bacterium]|nr:EamA family transporter [Clostridia bacterium]
MYYLLGISVLAASFNSILLNKARVIKKEEIYKFNLIGALVWCVILFVFKRDIPQLRGEVVFWGVLYGLTQSLFILFKTASMSSGSVSVTTLIGNCSLLISVFVSLIVWKENVTVTDVFGLGLLLTAIFMCTYKKSNSGYTSMWKYYVVFFLAFAALVGIVFKAFGKSGNAAFCDDMMLVSAVVMVVCCFTACMLSGGFKSNLSAGGRSFCGYAVVCGILSCLYNRLNIFLAGSMDAIIFFPLFNGGVVLLSALLSVWLCREKLATRQKAGILAGIAAICLIGIL